MNTEQDFLYSVIIPVYNVQEYLVRCVESVQQQTDQNLEIILVDDGSTDKSRGICDGLAKNDERIQVIYQKNQGAAVARNNGIVLARGEYITFLDSDDYWIDNNALKNIREEILKTNRPELILTGYKKYNLVTGKQKTFLLPTLPQVSLHEKKCFLLGKRAYTNAPWAKIIRRDFLEKNDLFFPEGIKSEDLIWCRKILTSAKTIETYSSPMVMYQAERADSCTTTFSQKHYRDILQQFVEELDFIKKAPEKIKVITRAYWAEQLCWFMGYFPLVNDKDLDKTITESEGLFFLLPYGLCNRTKIVNSLCNYIGTKKTIKILYIYLMRQKRKKHISSVIH